VSILWQWESGNSVWERCNMAIDSGIINFGNMAPVMGESLTERLQRWLDDSALIKILPGGDYLIDEPLRVSLDRTKIIGCGRFGSIIRASGAGTPLTEMLIVGKSGGALLSGVSIEGLTLVGFNSDKRATGGLRMEKVNFSYLTDFAVREIDGIGVHMKGVQDSEFRGLDVRFSGIYHATPSSATPGVLIENESTMPTNSLLFSGGCYERNKYAFIVSSDAVKFQGMKFHGRTTDDEATPDAADLLRFEGARRISIMGCQFAHARRYGVVFGQDSIGTASWGVVNGSSFSDAINYQTNGEAWNVVVEKGRCMISSNFFVGSSHASYTARGGDVWLQVDTQDAGGVNMHQGSPNMRMKNGYNLFYRQLSLGGLDFGAPANHPVLSFGAGNGAAVDTSVVRRAADQLGLSDGDKFYIEGTWNGGFLRMGPYRIWMDNTNNELRMLKNADPSGESVGTVIGP
jgi:hypothetical protein